MHPHHSDGAGTATLPPASSALAEDDLLQLHCSALPPTTGSSDVHTDAASASHPLPPPRLSASLGETKPQPLPHRHTLPRNATFHTPRQPLRCPSMLDRLTTSRSTGVHLDQPQLREDAVGATPLDRTMDRIGMGRYQWTLLILSGLGWAADNMWMQAVAIILPHVQRTFPVTDVTVGLASSSLFVGMLVGSLVWGTVSDSYGRRAAFNMTLVIAALFGSLSALSTSFALLCFLLFSVGSGVGGSLPTDSSNLVENLPIRKHSYVTALSIFFSAGAIVPSVIGLVVLSDAESNGWRWLLGCLSLVTIIFVAFRVVFFRLLESPKYLVHAGRPQEARDILHRIQRFNGGDPVTIQLRDVCDESTGSATERGGGGEASSAGPSTPRDSLTSTRRSIMPKRWGSSSRLRSDQKGYQSLPTDVEGGLESEEGGRCNGVAASGEAADEQGAGTDAPADPSTDVQLPSWLASLLESWHPATAELLSRYAELFSDEWRHTTILVWIIWGGMSFAYTTFNVFLPKLLEERYGQTDASTPKGGGSHAAMVDYLAYTISSLPGSLISAYLVETRLGRIGTMASSTALTGVSVLLFALFSWRASLTLISIATSISYAAIYGYTPEVMGPKIRGTACGSASAISRVTGIVAPLTAGLLFSIDSNLPLYLAVVSFGGVAVAMSMLTIETRAKGLAAGGEGGEEGGGGSSGALH